jgi:tellurite methyltransferase
MNRSIVEFFRDDESDWAARLDCGHAQHTRHAPPLSNRPWVQTEEGRAARIGTLLDCVLCDRGEMPRDHVAYQRTSSFDQNSVPAALLAQHSTKAGVWGLIRVESGELEYTIEDERLSTDAEQCQRLEAGDVGVVIAEVEHHVTPIGDVRFHVEFWRRDTR